MIIVGLLVENDPTIEDIDRGNLGLFKGGGVYLLGVQLLACLCIIVWSGAITFILLIVSRCGYNFIKLHGPCVYWIEIPFEENNFFKIQDVCKISGITFYYYYTDFSNKNSERRWSNISQISKKCNFFFKKNL